MKTKYLLSLLTAASFVTLTSCSPAAGGASELAHAGSRDSTGATVKVQNLEPNQEITEEVPTFLRIAASDGITKVKVMANGVEIGQAERDAREVAFRFQHSFFDLGDQDLSFQAFSGEAPEAVATDTVRVRVIPKNAGAPSRFFNAWVLKAVAHLTKNWGLLGYDINKQLTHDLNYNNQGTLKPTGGGLTMCVSGQLEVIVTALELYAKETGDKAAYNFLPFDSWNTLKPTNIKAHIWVNPKLNSSGTGDALAKFGIGENVRFQDLKPGGFININRTTGSGHAVTFLSFIDNKGRDVAEYDASKVVGFRYFGAQGRRIKGQGGFSYRHAFFAKYGCPEVPYQRDCNVILSDSQKLLNVGMMYMPKEWKKKSMQELVADIGRVEPLTSEEEGNIHDPTQFDGLTTDD